MFIAKRITLITPQVRFSINAKKALERDGEFLVHSFTTVAGGLRHLQKQAQDAVVLDFRTDDANGAETLQQIQKRQPNVALIVAPDSAKLKQQQGTLGFHAVIDLPYPLRDFVSVLRKVLREAHDAQPDTSPGTSMETDGESLMKNYAQTLEFWVTDQNGDTKTSIVELPESPTNTAEDTFHKLAAEEPPMPTLEDNSTIRDLRDSLANRATVEQVLSSLEDDTLEEETAPAPDEIEFEDDDDSMPVALILETAQDESTRIQAFSLTEFMQRVHERRHSGDAIILPLPSWVEESERYVREPDFLPESLPGFSEPLEYAASTTVPSSGQPIEQHPESLVTDPIEPVRRSKPPEEVSSEESDAADASELDADEVEAHLDDFAALQPLTEDEVSEVDDRTEVETVPQMPYSDYDTSDPQIAQMALMLTQVSLDLTAEATLLARDGQLVAYAGNLPRADIDDLREQIADDWETENERTRIRFITLPASGMDYMLYSRKTSDNLTLSMIFKGTMPLHVIRRQGNRLAEALDEVPAVEDKAPTQETTEEPETVIPEVEVESRFPATYIWLLNAPYDEIPQHIRSGLSIAMENELRRLGWEIQTLNVDEDFVYLYANVPETDDRQQIIHQLMTLSARLVKVDPNILWDDSYYVMQPGREMAMDEIQEYISFVRG